MSNNALTYTDSVICYKELIDKEDTARRTWKQKYGSNPEGRWRPVEPFEAAGSSSSKTELPPAMPASAIRNPPLYRDTVGNEGLSGGTPLRFGGRWDIVSEKVEPFVDPDKPQKVVKKGPHDCYCDVVRRRAQASSLLPLLVHRLRSLVFFSTSRVFVIFAAQGYNCWSMAGKARTANFGLRGTFEREFWTNTPGELALVWDTSKGE